MRNYGFRARSYAHGRFPQRVVVHLGVGVALIIAISMAVVGPVSSAPEAATVDAPPAVVYSGLAGHAPGSAQAFFSSGGSHTTHDSIQSLTSRPTIAAAVIMRTSDAVAPGASFSTGVLAATASSGEASSGVQPLADLIDPQKPYALYVAQPGDTVSTIAEQYGVAPSTILANNPEVTEDALIIVGQQLLVPRADGVLYTMRDGDSLEDVLANYDNVTYDDVLAFRPNAIDDPTAIETGRQILLPNATLKPPPPPPPPPPPAPTPAPPPVAAGDGSGDGTGSAPPPAAEPEAPVVSPPAPASGGRFALPLYAWHGISDPFGTNRGGGTYHTGTDFDLYSQPASPILSSCNGTVAVTEYLTYSYGYHIIIDCGDGWTTLYAHLSQIHVSPGQSVSMGETIGISGVTGYTTGEHLHFEIRLNGAYVNPADYLNF